MSKTKFYYFPLIKKPPYILYRNSDFFSTKLFKDLYFKLGSNTWKWRFRKNKFVSKFFELVFHTKVLLPTKNIDIIYVGYDNVIYFEMNRDYIYFKNNDIFIKKRFLGYHINFLNTEEIKEKYANILDFLRKHLQFLKSNDNKIHGDFSPFNILIDKEGKIYLIDPRPNNYVSKLYDHFYLYRSIISKINGAGKISKNRKQKALYLLNKLIVDCFIDEDKGTLLNELLILVEELIVINKCVSTNEFNLFIDIFGFWKLISQKKS